MSPTQNPQARRCHAEVGPRSSGCHRPFGQYAGSRGASCTGGMGHTSGSGAAGPARVGCMGLFSRRPRKDTPGQPSAAASMDLATEAPTAPAAVPTTWLAVPTMAEVGAQRPVAGTSFHQGLLADTDRELRSQSPVVDLVTVQLAVVESGEYAGAVGVYLAGRRAGSVPAGSVEAYRPVVAALTEQGRPATCRAAIVGGGGVLSFDLFGGEEARERDGARNFGLALL